MKNIRINLSLEELEDSVWSESEYSHSFLITTCHNLRKVPIRELSAESLRMLIGQNIGLPYIVPLALELLFENPWCCGDFYNGDLLQNVLKIGMPFWSENTELFNQLTSIISNVEEQIIFFQKELEPQWSELNERYYQSYNK